MPDEPPTPAPRVLCDDARALAVRPDAPSGVLWKLAESGRQLDANVVRLPPGGTVDTHAEPDLDVLVFVVSGAGTIHGVDGPQHLAAGALLWLPHGSLRSLAAGDDGLSYLTVHRRRPGMRIGRRP
jgi:quercetin dioxygenase-like cupin family protein